MAVVAHACSKPGVARMLHTGPIESIDTLTPFVISIQYPDDESLDDHTETYIGACGQYWLYSHRVSVVCGCFLIESEITSNKQNESAVDSSHSSDCEKGTATPE